MAPTYPTGIWTTDVNNDEIPFVPFVLFQPFQPQPILPTPVITQPIQDSDLESDEEYEEYLGHPSYEDYL